MRQIHHFVLKHYHIPLARVGDDEARFKAQFKERRREMALPRRTQVHLKEEAREASFDSVVT